MRKAVLALSMVGCFQRPECGNGKAEAEEFCITDPLVLEEGSSPISLLAAPLTQDGALAIVVADANNALTIIKLDDLSSPTQLALADTPRAILFSEELALPAPALFVLTAQDPQLQILPAPVDVLAPPPPISALTPINAMLFLDLDRDFDLEGILVSEANQVEILEGQADGSFLESFPLFINIEQPTAVAASDLDQNGFPDLIIASAQSLRVFLNNGNTDAFIDEGDFIEVPPVEDIRGVSKIKVADFNQDDLPDLVCNDENGLRVFQNFGCSEDKGCFSERDTLKLDAKATSLDVGDVDDNGAPDVVAVNPDGIFVFLNKGKARFLDRQDHPIDTPPTDVLLLDFTKDGHPDLVTANQSSISLFVALP